MAVNPIPEGYTTITPYFLIKDADAFIDFLVRAFDAKEMYRSNGPDGSILHADVMIGNAHIMLGQANEQHPPTSMMMNMYVEDSDKFYRQALDAGATSVAEVTDQFYGDRSGGVADPFGNMWWISTHVEDVSDEEMERRMKEQMG